MEKPKSITWKELKEFVNSIPEDQLEKKASVMDGDESPARDLYEPFFTVNDFYINKQDYEDCGTLDELKDLHGEDFVQDDYLLNTKKGTAFLWMN
ncbi:hypothetical protein EG359_17355 [Chryseobacterium joostei]|uniref:SMI1/KNR4 family protein n=1 Tax=Chryseobacterium joostei TaxID=112234 RepID=A0A1N7IB23_9FLAO|nr:hypothetical protein [Chryseobacterium joostei]AZB01271.1 hypothetical protein EG359_17355 [Chryseobacterium joostei]SIS34257.1 hypothetical protein SAMN05421768_103670 [Chryseobacterium joostei]